MLVNKNFNKRFWNKKRVFITGHTGFKGSWLFFFLINKGAIVHGFSKNYSTNRSIFSNVKLKKKQTLSNINNFTKLKKSIEKFKPNIIFHLAAQPLVIDSYKNSLETFQTNTMGTLNLLEICKKIKSLKSICVVTTDKVYDENYKTKYFNENHRLGGVDPYSSSKVAAEIICKSYFESFYKKNKISLLTVRAGNVIGGGDWSSNRLIPDIVRSSLYKKKLIVRNPNHIRPWQHVLDVLDAYLKLTEYSYNKNLGNSWNIGPNRKKEKKVIEVIKLFKNHMDFHYSIVKNKQKLYESELLQLNNKKIFKEIGWKSNLNLSQSIEWTINWYTNKSKNINKIKNQINKYIQNFN
tara:strand:+ start:1403 stop:2455 length:1053 start_codon:yes stop_codon:yes gene_type:complete